MLTLLQPWIVGGLVGIFVLYPFLIWRDGNRKTAAYFLDPVDFSSPVGCYASLHRERPLPRGWRYLLGHLIGLFHMFVFGFLFIGFIILCLFDKQGGLLMPLL